MSSDFRELVQRAGSYEFDPRQLDALPITGVLRKSSDSKNIILVMSNEPSGDLIVEIEADDVVRYEVEKRGEGTEEQVKLYVKPTAVVTTSFNGKAPNALVTALMANAAFGQPIREPLEVPWREIVTPFSRIDVMLNWVSSLAWAECQADCLRRFPNRGQAQTDCLMACGPPPKLRVSEGVLEKLVELFRDQIPGKPN